MRAWGSSGADRRPEGDLGVEPRAGTSVSLRVTSRLLMFTAARAHVRVAHAGTHRPSVSRDERRNVDMVRAIATRASRSAARRRGAVREWGAYGRVGALEASGSALLGEGRSACASCISEENNIGYMSSRWVGQWSHQAPGSRPAT